MIAIEITNGRPASGGYKVDVSRGGHNGRVSSEWFSRPDDEKYLSLSELYASVKGRAERSKTRTVESAATRACTRWSCNSSTITVRTAASRSARAPPSSDRRRRTFATNDERTAKRVSDALGTATEMRAMKNYAGHRLSPWLGHLMVSRQETARPLLTPGEMMQLPPTDEIVLVSGAPPVRAEKARYYADPQFKARIVPPPDRIAHDEAQGSSEDDWSGRRPISAPPPKKRKGSNEDADGGIRRQPDLPEHEDIAPEPTPARSEFADLDDEPEDDAQRAKAMRDRFGTVARQASLDHDDGIEL